MTLINNANITLYFDADAHASDGMGWCATIEPGSTIYRYTDFRYVLEFLEAHRFDLSYILRPNRWVIATSEAAGALYWSNEDGWGSIDTATVFTSDERDRLRLPIDGVWIPRSGIVSTSTI